MTTDETNQLLARYCQTIDTMRGLIEGLERDRDDERRRCHVLAGSWPTTPYATSHDEAVRMQQMTVDIAAAIGAGGRHMEIAA